MVISVENLYICECWDLEDDIGLTVIRKAKLLTQCKKETLGPT